MAVLRGTRKRDTIEGTSAGDAISGLAGADDLYGQRGNDKLAGGGGHDELWGGAGHDKLFGEAGDDQLKGDAGNDLLTGATGDDRLLGGTGTDTAVFAASWVSATISANAGSYRVTSAVDGSDTVSQVERFKFANGTFAASLILNDAPVAVADSGFATSEETALTLAAGDLLANDSDADAPLGDLLTIVSVQDAVGGTVALAGGQIVFTPAVDHVGPASFSYTVRDAKGATAVATADIDVSNLNDPPAAAADDLTALQLISRGYSFNALNAHWYRAEQGIDTGALTFSQASATAASYGGYLATITSSAEDAFILALAESIQANSSISDPAASRGAWIGGSDEATEGSWVWLEGPEAGQGFWTSNTVLIYANWQPGQPDNAGNEDHVFLAQNGHWLDYSGASAVAGYVVENEVGRPGDGSITSEDVAVNIDPAVLLLNDTDPDGDGLVISAVGATSAYGASVSLVDGWVVYDPTGAAALQTLEVGEHVIDTFTYTVDDGHGGTSTTSVSLAICGVSDAPLL